MEFFNQTLHTGFYFLIAGLYILWITPHVMHKINASVYVFLQLTGSSLCLLSLILILTGMIEGRFL